MHLLGAGRAARLGPIPFGELVEWAGLGSAKHVRLKQGAGDGRLGGGPVPGNGRGRIGRDMKGGNGQTWLRP